MLVPMSAARWSSAARALPISITRPDRSRSRAGDPTGDWPVSVAWITSAARYVPASLGWSPSGE
ncbi:MAG TPA: hypothetical protein VJ812_00635 [Gemmatimonadaceae bacterium]|nr:hypothetical protein [Gemmatimonadaceae bacterium]